MRPGTLLRLLVMPELRVSAYVRLISKTGGCLSFLLSQRLRSRYGVIVSDRAEIGEGVQIVHFPGVVIGSGVVVGNRSRIYQHVTLGQSRGGFPRIGTDVIVYAGAVVCGRVTVGDGAVIGANAVVLRDVPPGAIVAGVPARVMGHRGEGDVLY